MTMYDALKSAGLIKPSDPVVSRPSYERLDRRPVPVSVAVDDEAKQWERKYYGARKRDIVLVCDQCGENGHVARRCPHQGRGRR